MSALPRLPQWTAYQFSLGVVLAGLIGMAVLAPHGMSWLPVALALTTFALSGWSLPPGEIKTDIDALAPVGALLAWAFICTTFAANASFARFSSFAAACIIAAGYVNIVYVRTSPSPPLHFCEGMFLAWLCLAACLIALLYGAVDLSALRGMKALDPTTFNRGTCILVLLTPIIIMSFQDRILDRLWMTACISFVIGAAAFVAFSSQSKSAMLALPFVLVTLPAVYRWPWLGKAIVWLAIAVMFVALFVIQDVTRFVSHTPIWDFRPGSLSVRLAMWSASADLTFKSFLFGNGLEAFRGRILIDPVTDMSLDFIHPHSFIFQIWLEMGFVGFLLFSASLVAVTRKWPSHGRDGNALLHAMLVGALLVSSVSDGMWQPWWIGFLSLYFLFGFAFLRSRSARGEK